MAVIASGSLTKKQFSDLNESIKWSQRQLDFQRKKQLEAVRQYVGPHYARDGAVKPRPVNMTALAVQIYIRLLAARSPRVMITTKRSDLRPTAANFELAVNQIPKEIGLDGTFRRMVLGALFSMGIVKVGLHKTGTMLGHDYGESFVDEITLDDYFCDMSAKRRNLMDYEGNDYWLPYDELMESDWVDKEARVGLKPDEYTMVGPNGEERTDSISAGETAKQYKEKIWLRDVWLPSEKILVTYGIKSEKIFNTVELKQPNHGPYYDLGFADVPGNLLPLAPVSLWRDLDELGNSLFRKLGNQADSQKTVLGFLGGNDDSVADFQKARDGDGIHYNGAEPKRLTAGGIDPNTLSFYIQCRNLSSYFGGNLDSLGGLAAMTQTVGQDKLIGDAAGAQLRDMAAKTTDTVRDVFRALAYYEWTDPVKQRTLEKPIPGLKKPLVIPFSRKDKKGSIESFDLDIDVYSAQDDSPALKLQKLGAIVQQYVSPLAPLIQQTGGTIDVQAIFRDVARFSNMPEVGEYVTWMDQPPAAGASVSEPQMPANTTRTYERVGRPGPTRQGADAMMQQLLLGGNPGGNSSGE